MGARGRTGAATAGAAVVPIRPATDPTAGPEAAAEGALAAWRRHLLSSGVAPATVNQALAAWCCWLSRTAPGGTGRRSRRPSRC
ncbi:hypothetical protein Pta02_68560 [Planobispora takensis]|uniref:Uncharacterized protein n=1 Tax=Planobispora takensis TaxID=1367882 RepID=A0A8J3T623_9ACTN|nr:hypothetical protein Pta02_68560 [Planobispora takensis]